MKVNLRKASALQLELSKIRVPEIESIEISEFQDVAVEISKAKDKFLSVLKRRDRVVEAVYEIRKLVSKANAAAGIDIILADLARCEKDVKLYTQLSEMHPRRPVEEIQQKVESLAKTEARDRYFRDSVGTMVFDEKELDVFTKRALEAKKEKRKLQDQLLDLNVRTEIELSKSAVDVLTDEGLI